MLVLPIPLVVSLALAFLAAVILVRRDRSPLFAALLAAAAVQGVVVAAFQHYGVSWLHPVQPVTATVVPTLAWTTLIGTAVRPLDRRRDLVHLAGPVLTALAVVVWPDVVDLLVPGLFLGYGVAILHKLRSGSDGLPLTRLDAADRSRLVWSWIGLALVLSAASDGVIAVAHLAGARWLQPIVVSLFASGCLGMIGALALAQSLARGERLGGEARSAEVPPGPALGAGGSDPSADAERDSAIVATVEGLLVEQRLFLDVDLTLDRLARRSRIPAKRISAAVNRATGQNVSRWINGFRIRHACGLLAAGRNVTATMLESGFNTKSNFHREFLRVTGLTPTAWLARGSPARASEREDAGPVGPQPVDPETVRSGPS